MGGDMFWLRWLWEGVGSSGQREQLSLSPSGAPAQGSLNQLCGQRQPIVETGRPGQRFPVSCSGSIHWALRAAGVWYDSSSDA